MRTARPSGTLPNRPVRLPLRPNPAAGIAGLPLRFRIDATPAPDKVIFWQSHYGECFAVEPYYRRTLFPGSRTGWTHRIAVDADENTDNVIGPIKTP